MFTYQGHCPIQGLELSWKFLPRRNKEWKQNYQAHESITLLPLYHGCMTEVEEKLHIITLLFPKSSNSSGSRSGKSNHGRENYKVYSKILIEELTSLIVRTISEK